MGYALTTILIGSWIIAALLFPDWPKTYGAIFGLGVSMIAGGIAILINEAIKEAHKTKEVR